MAVDERSDPARNEPAVEVREAHPTEGRAVSSTEGRAVGRPAGASGGGAGPARRSRWRWWPLWLTWALGLAALAVVWGWALGPRPQRRASERATARAVASQLDGFVEQQASVVRGLADRLGEWESMPEAAVALALQATATRHLALRRLLVADPAGEVVSGYDAGRPVGRERLPAGRLDWEVGRREVLARGEPLLVLPATEAGTLRALEIGAAIRRADGSRPGYVGATVSLSGLRKRLRRLTPPGVALVVTTPGGHLVSPCRGEPPADGVEVAGERFVVHVSAGGTPGATWFAAILLSLFLSALLLLATLAFRRLDRSA
jgi:hypothetical protein